MYIICQNHDYEGLPLIQATFKSLGIRLLCDESETIQTGTIASCSPLLNRYNHQPAIVCSPPGVDFGAVQVIGTHYVFAERRKADHLQKICAKFPATVAAHSEDQHNGADDERNTEATEGDAAVSTTRLMLVHDPKGFAAVDPDERVIAFAGALCVVLHWSSRPPPIPHSSRRTGHNHGGQIGLETFGIRWTLPRAVFPVRRSFSMLLPTTPTQTPPLQAGLLTTRRCGLLRAELHRSGLVDQGEELLVCPQVGRRSSSPSTSHLFCGLHAWPGGGCGGGGPWLTALEMCCVGRGTGQHAFPFRWGVQREKSLLKVTISN
jgi:hypothetical protein